MTRLVWRTGRQRRHVLDRYQRSPEIRGGDRAAVTLCGLVLRSYESAPSQSPNDVDCPSCRLAFTGGRS